MNSSMNQFSILKNSDLQEYLRWIKSYLWSISWYVNLYRSNCIYWSCWCCICDFNRRASDREFLLITRKVISIFYIISLGVLSLLKSQDIVDIIATLLLICIGLKGINQKGTL